MKIKKNLVLIILSCTLLTSCNPTSGNKIQFSYPQSTANDYLGTCFYDDSYFEQDSTIYNNSLSTCSIAFAMASFASNSNKDNVSYRYNNCQAFLQNTGFSNIDVNKDYKIKAESDTLGVIFGSKKIGNTTLIAAGIRGGNYEMEWASNVTLGDGEEIKQHLGFYQASSIYLTSLEEYISKYSITGDVKLWSVGYSRGGACNNLAVGRLDQMINNNEKIFDGKINLKKENIYCYCFENPMGASFKEEISPKSEIYSNIHNIINFNDPVSKVAMDPKDKKTKFRFTRYGVDYYLPDSIRNVNYDNIISKVTEFYNDMDNHVSLGDYYISSFSMSGASSSNENSSLNISENTSSRVNWTSGLFLEEFISYLTVLGVKDLTNYVNNFQSGLREIFEIVYKNGSPKFSLMTLGVDFTKYLLNSSNVDIMINNLLHDPQTFIDDFLVLLKTVLADLELDISPSELINSLKSLIEALVQVFANHIEIFFTFLNLDNIRAIISGHFPELCFAHLMSQDKNYGTPIQEYNSDGSYYYLFVPNVDENSYIEIDDESGNMVAKLENGVLSKDGKLSYACLESNFIGYIPVEKSYNITIKNASYYNLSYFDQTQEDLVKYKSSNIEDQVNIQTETYPTKTSK